MKQKSLMAALIMFAIITCAAFVKSGQAFAINVPSSAEFVIGMNQYFINDWLPGISMDAAPYIDSSSGRTMVPVRYLGNALGVTDDNIKWNSVAQQVYLAQGGTTIDLTIGSTTMTANGLAQTMDATPVINNGRTYLPARWVAQALGYNVDWDGTDKTAIFWSKDYVTEPLYINVIALAKHKAGKPAAVQKLEQALGIKMIENANNPGNWYYDGFPGPVNDNQIGDNTYVSANYAPGDGSVGLQIEGIGMPDLSQVNPDISPIHKVLEAFFPGQETDINQVMIDAQNDVANGKKYDGGNIPPPDIVTINGTKVGISQGMGFTGVIMEIMSS